MLTKIESENRYVLRAGGETVFVGAEASTDFQRLCCGSARAFHLTLVDPTQQEAISYLRRLGCSSGLLGCLLQVGKYDYRIKLTQWLFIH